MHRLLRRQAREGLHISGPKSLLLGKRGLQVPRLYPEIISRPFFRKLRRLELSPSPENPSPPGADAEFPNPLSSSLPRAHRPSSLRENRSRPSWPLSLGAIRPPREYRAPGVKRHRARERMAADVSRLHSQNSPADTSAMAARGKRSTRYFRFCKLTRDLARPIISWRERGAALNEKGKLGKKLMTSVSPRLGGELQGTAKLSSPGPGASHGRSGFRSCVLREGSFLGGWRGLLRV